MLAQHLLQDLWRGHGQAVGGEGLDVLAILYSEVFPPDVMVLLRGGRGIKRPDAGRGFDHRPRPQTTRQPGPLQTIFGGGT